MKKQPTDTDRVNLLRTHELHCRLVRSAMLRITQDLERRSLEHDTSKLRADEFDGFSRINRIARECEYGSPEYTESLAQEEETVETHYRRNSHHPQFHNYEAGRPVMGWLDIVEMVCDWYSAHQTYSTPGSGMTWSESVSYNVARFGFDDGQTWLILQVAHYLEPIAGSDMPQKSTN